MNDQRIKLLRLVEILRADTDEAHPLTTTQLCQRLNAYGISCDRRTLSDDMAFLNRSGFEVMDCRVGHAKGYYMVDRSFSDPELKVLIDAVQAASFITEGKTAELTDKIASLGGSHRADILRTNLVHFNTRKHTNETFLYSISALEQALLDGVQVSFLYFDLDEHHHRVLRHDGQRQVVQPVALIYSGATYYLLCYAPTHEDRRATYRIDRMQQVRAEKEPVSREAIAARATVSDYTGQTFDMYSGVPKKITLQFERHALGAIYDAFGEDLDVFLGPRGSLQAIVTVRVSPTFWGWLFTFHGDVRIVEPEDLLEEYRGLLDAQRKLYRRK